MTSGVTSSSNSIYFTDQSWLNYDKADTHPDKINLGVGVYQDATGKTPILKAVTQLRLIF